MVFAMDDSPRCRTGRGVRLQSAPIHSDLGRSTTSFQERRWRYHLGRPKHVHVLCRRPFSNPVIRTICQRMATGAGRCHPSQKLERGARVADVGCGHGVSTMLMAKAFPIPIRRLDFHPGSIEAATAHAAEGTRGVRATLASRSPPRRTIPERTSILCWPSSIVCTTWVILPVQRPMSVESLETGWVVDDRGADGRGSAGRDNINPVGRLVLWGIHDRLRPDLTITARRSARRWVQAGEARLREVITAGGFRSVAAGAPFDVISL